MEQSLHINRNNDVFEEIEDIRVKRKSLLDRKDRKVRRSWALETIDVLAAKFGGLQNIPDDHPTLNVARRWLGAFDDDVTETDVQQLRQRVAGLAKRHKIAQSDVFRILAYYLDLSPQTVKDKAYNNRFTYAEADIVWAQLDTLETVDNLKMVVHLYNKRQEEYRARRAQKR